MDKVAQSKTSESSRAGESIAPAIAALDKIWQQATREAAKGVRKPLAVKDLKSIWNRVFSAEELDTLVIARRTLVRRKQQSGKLSLEETDRAMRLARIAAEAGRVFANAEKASRWLRNPQARLAGQTPLSLLESESGAAVVGEILVQIDHGTFV